MTDAGTRRGREPGNRTAPVASNARGPAPGTQTIRETLREVRDEDLEALYELDQLCFEPEIAYSRAEISRFLALPTAEAVALERGGRLAGFAIGHLVGRRVGSVLTLDVAPGERRRGTGRSLLEEIVSRLERRGARKILLEVDVRNRGAIAFYERLGFETSNRVPDYYGEGRDAFEMVRRLASLERS